jgi:Taurine catabolism dioxygenase TauD, TfdA family
MDFSKASVVPQRVGTPAQARAEVTARGAAILSGLGDQEAAFAAGRAFLGADLRRFGLQFEASKDKQEAEAAVVADQPADERGRKRRFTATQERMVAHNDGFGFGDFGPDYLFLWCGRPDAGGEGASFLVDGLALVGQLAADPDYEDVARFAWETDIDQSEPNFPLAAPAPIARRLPATTLPATTLPAAILPSAPPGIPARVQIRHHPFQAPVPGQAPDIEVAQSALIARWSAAVTAARDSGPMFQAAAGDMICVDNYRLTHGRDGFSDPGRVMLSIWGWSSAAIAVPEGPLDIVRPVIPSPISTGMSAPVAAM